MSDTETGVAAFFDIGVKLGSLTDEVKSAKLEARRRAREKTPVAVNWKSAVTIPTPTAPTAMGLGGPEVGFFWELRSIVVGGLTYGTAAAGTAEVYVTAQSNVNIATNRTTTELVDQATSLPLPAGYSSGQVIVQHGEALRVVIVGGTAAQQYVAVAYWRQYPTVAMEADVQA